MNPLKQALGLNRIRLAQIARANSVTRTGTCNFVSESAAVRYYGTTLNEIKHKIKEGEIRIGKPQERQGFRIVLNPAEGRYEMVG